jgi:signal transduction histidine kinase
VPTGRRGRTGLPVVASLLAASVLAVTAVGAGAAYRARERAEARDLARDAATVGVRFVSAFDGAVLATSRVAARLVERDDTTLVESADLGFPDGASVGFVAVDGGRLRVAAGDVGGIRDLGSPTLAVAFDSARDAARTVVGDPVAGTDGPLVPIVRPIFLDSQDHLSIDPEGAFAKRNGRPVLAGYVLTAVDGDVLLRSAAPVGLDIRVRDSTGAIATVAARRGGPSQQVVLPVSSDQRWTLDVARAPSRSAWWVALATAAGGGVVALVVLGAGLTELRRRRALEREDRALRNQLRTLREVAPVVQQSLAVADVLPAVAVRLHEDLALAGVAITVEGEGEPSVDAFATGSAPDRTVPVRLDLPDEVPAGGTIAVPLQRAGRSVGVLRVRAGRRLGEAEISTIVAVGEMVAAAISNARMFAAQELAVRRLRELDDMKNVFLGTASHELVTPTTALAGFAQLLERHWDELTDENRREFVARITANALALDGLVRDLLDFSRLERGRIEAVNERVDLSAVVADVLARVDTAFESHGFDVAVEPDLWIMGDADAVGRVLTNLLSNAAKFSPEASAIGVSVARANGMVRITVDDHGPGVPADERDRIFDRFYRGHGDAVIRTRGAGIGLAVVRELVTQMGGTVSVGDAPGGGARFMVDLQPVAPVGSIERQVAATRQEDRHASPA